MHLIQQEKNKVAFVKAYPQLQEEIASGKPKTEEEIASEKPKTDDENASASGKPKTEEGIASGKPKTERSSGLAAFLNDHLIDLSLFIDLPVTEPESVPASEPESVELETLNRR